MATKPRPATTPAPSTTTPYLTTPSTSTLQTLSHLSTLLHLLHHRNKNQHRLATWYRRFSTLRSHLSRLLRHYTLLVSIPETHAARHRKKTQDVSTRAKIVAELEFWTETLVGKWCQAFSQLAADLRFGVLGVFLLAVVGEVAGVTGVTAALEERGEKGVLEAIEKFGREFEGENEDGLGLDRRVERAGEDLGEVLVREPVREENDDQDEAVVREQATGVEDAENGEAEDLIADVEPKEAIVSPSEEDRPTGAITKKRARPAEPVKSKDELVKKKKKRRKNAIDELFGAL